MYQKPFTILTESGHRYHRLKRLILRFGGKILGRKIYGPMSVYHSLIRGVEQLKKENAGIVYNTNPPLQEMYETALVLIGKDTLQYAIYLKKKGKIKNILAGPNISIPIDYNDIFFHSEIDTILVPSYRVKQYFGSLCKYKPERIQVRPAGVADTSISKKSKQQILIYKKTCPESLYSKIVKYLDTLGIVHKTIHYGHFKFSEYQQLLDESIAMIYLQESESQGIALQESWIKDIATLVRDRGYRTYKGEKKRQSKKISCPFLNALCGKTFNEKTFEHEFTNFMKNLQNFTPRTYCLKHLNDKSSTKILLSLIH